MSLSVLWVWFQLKISRQSWQGTTIFRTVPHNTSPGDYVEPLPHTGNPILFSRLIWRLCTTTAPEPHHISAPHLKIKYNHCSALEPPSFFSATPGLCTTTAPHRNSIIFSNLNHPRTKNNTPHWCAYQLYFKYCFKEIHPFSTVLINVLFSS